MASTKILNEDSYKKDLETKLSEYRATLKAYKKSKDVIAKLPKDASANLVFVPNKTIQTDGRPVMGAKQSTKELCKSTITGNYKAALYSKNGYCGLFTTDKPPVIDSNDASDYLIRILQSPDYARIYGDIVNNNKMFLNELTNMSKQLEADRNEINKQTGLTLTQEMDELDETQKMTKLTADSNYYISSLFVFVLVIIVIGGIYLMVPSSTNGAVQTGGGKLSKQSYFMVAILLLASIIIYQLRSNRH